METTFGLPEIAYLKKLFEKKEGKTSLKELPPLQVYIFPLKSVFALDALHNLLESVTVNWQFIIPCNRCHSNYSTCLCILSGCILSTCVTFFRHGFPSHGSIAV